MCDKKIAYYLGRMVTVCTVARRDLYFKSSCILMVAIHWNTLTAKVGVGSRGDQSDFHCHFRVNFFFSRGEWLGSGGKCIFEGTQALQLSPFFIYCDIATFFNWGFEKRRGEGRAVLDPPLSVRLFIVLFHMVF